MQRNLHLTLMGLMGLTIASSHAADPARDNRRPDNFGIIYQMGYAGDNFPKEEAEFEKVLLAVKEAHYDTVLCQHTPEREALCKKHGVKMMVDLLVADHHVYKNPEAAEKLCTSLRKSESIYGYHLWSDQVGGQIAGRNRDIANVQKWDPNHATYLGDRSARAIGGLSNPDLIGYYDFQWKRGGHFGHLVRAWNAAKKTDSFFLKYADGAPGRIGVGNYNRVLYTISTSVAFGLKGYTYHHTGHEIDKSTWKWKTLGEDLSKVNAMIAPLGPELMKIGNPKAVYSTPITLTAKNRPTGADPAVPAGFEAVPAEAKFKVVSGEAIIGVFDAEKGREALVLANHNCYLAQKMELEFSGEAQVALFDRSKKSWTVLKANDGKISFEIPEAAVELLLVKR